LERLRKFGLLDQSIFVTLDEQGNVIEEPGNKSIAFIYTMGKNGSDLLYEIGRNDAVYRPFERYQNGNMVKAKLAAKCRIAPKTQVAEPTEPTHIHRADDFMERLNLIKNWR
jgi:hypothetical protein